LMRVRFLPRGLVQRAGKAMMGFPACVGQGFPPGRQYGGGRLG